MPRKRCDLIASSFSCCGYSLRKKEILLLACFIVVDTFSNRIPFPHAINKHRKVGRVRDGGVGGGEEGGG